jgi:hypothetical protein
MWISCQKKSSETIPQKAKVRGKRRWVTTSTNEKAYSGRQGHARRSKYYLQGIGGYIESHPFQALPIFTGGRNLFVNEQHYYHFLAIFNDNTWYIRLCCYN